MPGAPDIIDSMDGSSTDNILLMKGQASLYSTQGLLNGMLTLYQNKLVWNEISSRSSNMLTISMDAMFGATLSPESKFKFKSFEAASETNLSIESSTHFTVYTIMAREKGKRPLCDTWTFMAENEEESATWVSLLRSAIHPNVDGAHVLLMLNPVSGRRKALKIFETIVKPMFEIGCTPYTLKISESPSHTSEIVLSADLSQYTSIVTVSGDGLLHDALNGLVSRKDWPKYRDMPLGVIPAGSGNGLAKSLDCIWPEQATVSVIKAHARPLDVMSVTLGSGITKYCFLSATWGLMADIDIESERMRWAGPARFDLYGMLRLMKLRYYGGRLHYLPALEHDDSDSPQRDRARKMIGSLPSGNSSMINVFSERTNHGIDDAWGLPPPSFSSPLIRNSPKQKPSSLALNVQPALTLKPTLTGGIQLPIREGSLPPRWKTVEGPFVQVMALNAPWVGAHFLASPYARLSDGMIDLVYSTAVSKWQVIPYMTNPVGDDHMNKDGVVHVKVRAMILEPTGLRTTNTNPRSHQMIQSPDATTNGQAAKSTNRFGSVRSLVTSTSNANKKDSTLAPQVPVPSRARSRTYATYHKQMAARGSSLLVQGLGVKQPADIDGSAAAAAAAAATSNGIDMPRIPGQALFSQRSETELAQINQETSSARELSSPSATNGNSSTPAAPSQLGTVSAAANGAAQEEFGSKPDQVDEGVDENGSLAESRKSESAMNSSEMLEGNATGCRLAGNSGIVALDGEASELGPIKVECLANLVHIIHPPWLNESSTNRVGTMPPVKTPEPIQGSLSRQGSVLSFANA